MTQIGASGWIGRAIELCSPGNKNNEMLRGVPDMKSSSLRAARFLRTSALGVSIAMAAVAAPAFAQDAPADTETDDSDNTPTIVPENGRASCRGRRCQEGLYSGVAGQLKKTNNSRL